MQWFSLLIFCAIIRIVVIANPLSKRSLKDKTKLHGKETHSKAGIIKTEIDALEYLTRYGFNHCQNPGGSKPTGIIGPLCQSSMETMLTNFQAAFHLPVTKKLDSATLNLMNTPRCGVADASSSYMVGNKLWPTDRTLKWKLKQDDIFSNLSKTHQGIKQAFDDWGRHAGLTFREATGRESADFHLAFMHGDHKDGFPFDGPGGTLAHAFYPWQVRSGDIHFDSTEKWSNTYDGVSYNLGLIAAHQIGHSLGLEHTNETNSIMYPFYQRIAPKDILSVQDQNRIRALYQNKQLLSAVKTTPQTTIKTAGTTLFSSNTKWGQKGTTVAGGNGRGNKLNQITDFRNFFMDDDQNILIADYNNHRIVEWKKGAKSGQVVAGAHGAGKRNDQLNLPTDVIVDKQTNSLIICDGSTNRRIVRWPRRGGKTGEVIFSNIACARLVMDNDGYLYVSDWDKQEVRRWRVGEKTGTLVAAGREKGDRLDQLNAPHGIFVDRDHSVYVSDTGNHRVMKWVKHARDGIIVAGGKGAKNGLNQLSNPEAVFVDHLGTVYIADQGNHRIMRWLNGSTQGTVIVGGNGSGKKANQLHSPMALSFDRQGNLYVGDRDNFRVQKFQIEVSSKGK